MFRLHVHHYYHLDKGDADNLCQAIQSLGELTETLMAITDDLKAAVERNTSAEDSVITLLNGISQQLKAALAANDPAAIQDAITKLDAGTAAAAAAVVANTTPAPTPPVA